MRPVIESCLVCPFFQGALEPLDFTVEDLYRLWGLFKITPARDLLHVEGGLESRLRRKVPH